MNFLPSSNKKLDEIIPTYLESSSMTFKHHLRPALYADIFLAWGRPQNRLDLFFLVWTRFRFIVAFSWVRLSGLCETSVFYRGLEAVSGLVSIYGMVLWFVRLGTVSIGSFFRLVPGSALVLCCQLGLVSGFEIGIDIWILWSGLVTIFWLGFCFMIVFLDWPCIVISVFVINFWIGLVLSVRIGAWYQ